MVLAAKPLLTPLVAFARPRCVVRRPLVSGGNHVDAIDRTGRHAQIAAGAAVRQHRVHELVRADDGIHRASLYAKCATYTVGFVYDRDAQRHMLSAFGVKGKLGRVQDFREQAYALRAAGRAAIDGFAFCRQGARIGQAAIVSALRALGLRECGIDAFDE